MANDGKKPSDWFSEQLSDLKDDLGQLEDRLRAPGGERPGNGNGNGNGGRSSSSGISRHNPAGRMGKVTTRLDLVIHCVAYM